MRLVRLVASTSGAVARAAAARCAASRTCDLLHARSRGLCSSCACSAGVGRRLLASNLCSASTASRMRRLCLHDIRAIGNQPFVFVSSASCAVRARVRLQLRRSARPHSLVARLCRLVISFVSYAVRARVRLQLRRSARSHPFVEDYRDIVRVVCSPRPCAAAASLECSFVLLRRATFSYARLARFV